MLLHRQVTNSKKTVDTLKSNNQFNPEFPDWDLETFLIAEKHVALNVSVVQWLPAVFPNCKMSLLVIYSFSLESTFTLNQASFNKISVGCIYFFCLFGTSFGAWLPALVQLCGSKKRKWIFIYFFISFLLYFFNIRRKLKKAHINVAISQFLDLINVFDR